VTGRCGAPISDEALLEYWAGDGPADEATRIEEHLFECADCSDQLQHVASIGAGLTALLRQGRTSGLIPRALVNRMQRDGITLRLYTVSPGETVPCAAFPGDDFVVASLRADFTGIDAVTLSVTGPGNARVSEFNDVPVSTSSGEVFWALSAAVARQLPSTRLQITLRSAADDRTLLGEYVLEHSGTDPAPR
jgi:anti-sigma factor RsiW